MRRPGAWLLALAVWGWGAAAMGLSIVVTPEMDLDWARCRYERGMIFLLRGMVEEAESELEKAGTTASGRGLELKWRTASLAILQKQSEVIQGARSCFEADWTTAVEKAETMRKPLQRLFDLLGADKHYTTFRYAFAGLGFMEERLHLILQELDALSEKVSEGRQRDALNSLEAIQEYLDWEIADSVALMEFADDFNEVGTAIVRGLMQLRQKETLPSDVNQALALAKSRQEQATAAIGTESWAGAALDLYIAKTVLEDVLWNGEATDEAEALAAMLAETERQYWLCGVRHHLDRARHFAEIGSPFIQREVDVDLGLYLAPLSATGGEEYEALVREAEELKGAAERMLKEQP